MTLDLTADVIDVRDIIARFEELEAELESADINVDMSDNVAELGVLNVLLADLRGNGGDEQWNGDWYPVTLIRESHFTEYMKELIIECDGLPEHMPKYLVIDWDATADNCKVDYSECEIDGVTYYYR